MKEHIYRVDTRAGIDAIKDGIFRAKRWGPPHGSAFPHKEMAKIPVAMGEGLFIICFYTAFEKAEKSQEMDYRFLGPSEILRCEKRRLIEAGFTQTWDDGFREGDAYLFWVKEPINTASQEFSEIGVPLADFEILHDGNWIALGSRIGRANRQVPVSSLPATVPTRAPAVGRRSPISWLRSIFSPDS
jgi:hypothetical protein